MKTFYKLTLLCCSLLFFNAATAQTFWDGPTITFTKEANADWTMPENQDQITDSVHITRKTQWPIFNIAKEDINPDDFGFCDTWLGPQGTEWAWGSIADGVQNLTFDGFLGDNFTDCGPGGDGISPIDSNVVLHLIVEDIYIDIKFLSWGMGMNGGGSFSYERSTDPALSTIEIEPDVYITLYPNPAQEQLQINGFESIEQKEYTIFNTAGSMMDSGLFTSNESVNIEKLPTGIYYFKIGSHNQVLKFVKTN